MTSAISVKGGSVTKPGAGLVLCDIDLDIAEGEAVALVGRSGSGKTTLLNCLGLLERFDKGCELRLNGEELQAQSQARMAQFRGRNIGFVFQRFFLLPRLSAVANVKVGLRYAHVGGSARDRHRVALTALDQLGLRDLARRRPGRLSGGQQQRVAIARALAKQPKLILADEPTGSLDEKTSGDVVRQLVELTRSAGATLMMVTHESSLVDDFDRVIRLEDGRIVT